MDAGEPSVDGVFVRRSRGRHWHGRVGIVRRAGVHVVVVLVVLPRAVESHRDMRAGLHRRFPCLRRGANGEPRPVASVARGREADGHGVPERRAQVFVHAALRSVVRGGIPQLLLLGTVHCGVVHPHDRHRHGCRGQSGRPNVLRTYRRGRVQRCLQPRRGGACEAPAKTGTRRPRGRSREEPKGVRVVSGARGGCGGALRDGDRELGRRDSES